MRSAPSIFENGGDDSTNASATSSTSALTAPPTLGPGLGRVRSAESEITIGGESVVTVQNSVTGLRFPGGRFGVARNGGGGEDGRPGTAGTVGTMGTAVRGSKRDAFKKKVFGL